MNIIGVARDIEGNHAGAAEAGIEAAVGIQPDRAEVAIDAAAQQDLAIGLHGQVIAVIVAAVEDEPAVAAEAGIESAVGVQPDRTEIVIASAGVEAVPRQQDSAVGLHGQASAVIVVAGDIEGGLAIAAEAGVEDTVGAQPEHTEVR